MIGASYVHKNYILQDHRTATDVLEVSYGMFDMIVHV